MQEEHIYRNAANAIRILTADAIEAAQSGHPGMPMGMADIAATLWLDFLKHDPKQPNWLNRDRFVVSNGHGSMLLYALLHLSGYPLSINEIKNFRQLHSQTPGHPEYGLTPGVETTTGPLGQGLANAVGMAIAERTLAAQFNRASHNLIDHFTYVFAGDGCLMEGISHESCSLAGTLGLGKLIVFWDDNGISIDGQVSHWCKDDVAKRFQSYGWDVIEGVDGHDPAAIHQAIVKAQSDLQRPTLIACKTLIAYGAPNLAGSEKAHGAPLGQAEIRALREALGWDYPPFDVPETIQSIWDATAQGKLHYSAWQQDWQAYQQTFPDLAAELQRRLNSELPSGFKEKVHQQLLQTSPSPDMATRKASAKFLAAWAAELPELFGGSADLTCSNLTSWPAMQAIHEQSSGQYLYYGVREFGMFAIMNGIALYQGFIPFGGTFLTFIDYGRNALRMAALMQLKTVFVLTHDSIGLGEDGPTHQPIEHLTMLRATPGVEVWRPCDGFETQVAWLAALTYQGPSCLALSRQTLPEMVHASHHLSAIERGAYVIYEPEAAATTQQPLDALIIATGSEVALAVAAAQQLAHAEYCVRVVSMPCMERFSQQDRAYQEQILPPEVTRRLAVEAGATMGWWQWVGSSGKVLGIDRFGESAPAPQIFQCLGITEETVVTTIEQLCAADRQSIN